MSSICVIHLPADGPVPVGRPPLPGGRGTQGADPAFISVAGLGETAALSLAEQAKGRRFISVEEVSAACPKVSKTHIDKLTEAGAFGDMPATAAGPVRHAGVTDGTVCTDGWDPYYLWTDLVYKYCPSSFQRWGNPWQEQLTKF